MRTEGEHRHFTRSTARLINPVPFIGNVPTQQEQQQQQQQQHQLPEEDEEEEDQQLEHGPVDILETVYYNPRAPGSFGGVDALLRQVRGTKRKRDVLEWLEDQETYTLHKPVRKRFKRDVIVANDADEQWESDLCEMSMPDLVYNNDDVSYLLVNVDVKTKYAVVIPMEDKTAESAVEAFRKAFQIRKPAKLRTDHGKEFDNVLVRTFMKKEGVFHFFTYNPDIKASIAERFNRTLKGRIWRYMTYKKTFRYIDVLQDIVHSYNNSYHRSIKMTPEEASRPENAQVVWQNLYGHTAIANPSPVTKFKYKVGDFVRISEERDVFRKGYRQGWSKEVYVVVKQSPRNPPVYRIHQLNGEPVIGSFYEPELQKVGRPPTYEIERILKTRGEGPRAEYFVKFKNYPDYNNEWLSARNIAKLPE
jgi:transposase InsO family protein